MRQSKMFLVVAVLAAAGATSCSSSNTSIEQSWRSPTLPAGELRNVVAMCLCNNEAVGRTAEDKLARKLAERGIGAVPAYQVLSARSNPDTVAASLRKAGYDGVVTIRFVGAERKVEGTPTMDNYWGEYWSSRIPESIIRAEISAFLLKNSQLVWTAVSKSVEPDGIGDLVDEVTTVVSRELEKQHVIGGPAET